MKPKFLLHVCCGPCCIAIFEELKEQFDLTVYFYNPNIHPIEEYKKRKEEVIKICQDLDIPFVEEKYNAEEWFEEIKGLEEEPEGGKRCPVCFRMRLKKTAEYASQNGFEYFGTTLTSGRNKRADIINPIGVEIGEELGVKFYEEDWKKKGRQESARQLCSDKEIYRQHYCGCTFSRRKV